MPRLNSLAFEREFEQEVLETARGIGEAVGSIVDLVERYGKCKVPIPWKQIDKHFERRGRHIDSYKHFVETTMPSHQPQWPDKLLKEMDEMTLNAVTKHREAIMGTQCAGHMQLLRK